ncbi:MAG: hypothetical protein NT145_06015 [Elusimicrobia bacterium]|nr:hypothetical protein [Elusimicrobiota bacterium]
MFLRCWTLILVLLFSGCFSYCLSSTFELYDKGSEDIVDYEKYGTFVDVGKNTYAYKMADPAGLKKAVGEGIFPNVQSVLQDPKYKEAKAEGKLEGTQWDYVNTDNFQLNFYKWATIQDDPGVKLYYTALALERSGDLLRAIKAYYAIAVHFPRSSGVTYWGTVWYIGPVAINKIRYLCREHPELGILLEKASIYVLNSFDASRGNDIFIINPGKIVRGSPQEFPEPKVDFSKLKIVKLTGTGRVKLAQWPNKQWTLFVDGEPYIIRGMAYSPNKVGLSPDTGTLNPSKDWMWADNNKNGIIDGAYEAFVDKNRNNLRDKTEKTVGDFKLMKKMGVNTLRLYHHGGFNNELLMNGYKNYGFMYLMGDFLGMYATGSGAEWYSGTDYTDPQQQENMLDSVKKMVEKYKDQPYILMWVLGNENNYGIPGIPGKTPGSGCRAKQQPDAYYEFVNKAAALIKSLDPEKRPVAVSNGDLLYLDICAQKAPEVDVFGCNSYRGEQGFGNLFWDVKNAFDRPVLITEYGCSAFHKLWNRKRAEEGQADYHRGNWIDIESNFSGSGEGNALGGVIFEWIDEWWKAGPPPKFLPDVQDKVPQFGAPFLDGWSYEEFMGITSQGKGKLSPFLRQLRPAYFTYMKLWEKYRQTPPKSKTK